jgi:uncharacterized repeat protein (TIGR01451 family)
MLTIMPPAARRRSLLALTMTGGLIAAAASIGPAGGAHAVVAVQAPTSCGSPVSLVNGGFEDPSGTGPRFIDQSLVPGWSTTATDDLIELWGPGTGVPTGSGAQFAELNATQASTLYQDVATTPGQVLKWELQHRGRIGTDVMAVLLGPAGGTLVQQGGTISDDDTAWGTHSDLYTVPPGQTTTRFAFQAVSSAGGDPGLGNFLDSISLGNAACVIATATVSNTSRPGTDAVVGDVLEFSVELTNNGGVPATGVVITDAVPAGTTFVPGSIVGSAGGLTDALLDDAGEYDTGTVRVRVGDGASAATGGSIPAGESRTVTFRVLVDAGTVGMTLADEATAVFVESLSGSASSSTSNSTSTLVLPSADLEVMQTLDTTLGNNAAARYTITVVNHGPQASADTELISALPLTGMTANDPDCTIVLAQLDCDLGSLAASASRVIVITGTVPATAVAGTSYQLSSTASGSVHDPDTTDNDAITTNVLASVGALTVDMTLTNTTGLTPGRPAHPGDLVQATYLVTNTGSVDLTTLTLSDPVFGPVTCATATLTRAAPPHAPRMPSTP